jgi:hypothetical protein
VPAEFAPVAVAGIDCSHSRMLAGHMMDGQEVLAVMASPLRIYLAAASAKCSRKTIGHKFVMMAAYHLQPRRPASRQSMLSAPVEVVVAEAVMMGLERIYFVQH